MNKIKYISGIKYQLVQDYVTNIGIHGYDIELPLIKLNPLGRLTIKKFFAWDGPSGPTIDTKSAMRGSLEHDALYMLLRHELLPQSERDAIDDRLENICVADGMNEFRADLWNAFLEPFGKSSANPKNKRKVHEAP